MASFSVNSVEQQMAEVNSAAKLKIVTTFSILADLFKNVGGQYVEVHTLVDWDEDAHVFHPSPADVRRLTKADLLVLNGLGFEGWLERLISSSNFNGKLVTAASGVDVIKRLEDKESDHHDHHDHHLDVQGFDPHAWHSLSAVKKYIDNILNSLVELDKAHQAQYQHNASRYLSELDKLESETKLRMSKLSEAQRNIVIPHNAFAYLARDFGLHVYSLKGISTEAEASAAQIAQVIRKIKSENIHAVFTETTGDDRLMKLVQQETDARMGGALISGALSKKLAPTYLDMMRYNIEKIIHALSSRE